MGNYVLIRWENQPTTEIHYYYPPNYSGYSSGKLHSMEGGYLHRDGPANGMIRNARSSPQKDIFGKQPQVRLFPKEAKNSNQKFTQKDKNKEEEEKMQLQSLQEHEKQLQEVIESYKQGIEKAKEYGRKMMDVTKYDEFRREALQIFINRIKELHFPEQEVDGQNFCTKLVVGKVSSGKSSLLNKLFGFELEVGMGETTEEPMVVYQQNGIRIIDTPGENEHFNTQNLEIIKLLASANQVYICYPDSLKNIEQLVRVICGVKPKHTFFVRTYCDMASSSQQKTLEAEVEADWQVLQDWGIPKIKIFLTSGVKDGFQNQALREKLLSHPSNR